MWLRGVLVLALALCAAALAPAAAPAHRYDVRVGIGDQSVEMFDQPAFHRADIRQVRLFVPWNAMHHRSQRLRARRWVQRARRHGARPLIHLHTEDIAGRRGALPTARHFRRDAGRLVRYLRRLGVRDFGAWNEANHSSQPTARHPRQAARYFRELHRAVFRRCSRKRCRVVALDVLDQAGADRYVRRFFSSLSRTWRRRARTVGIHNYSDVNRRRTSGTRRIMRAVRRHNRRANFWWTETGAVYKFGRSFPCSEQRAAARLKFLFSMARDLRRHVDRVYVYNWFGVGCEARFDAGLTSRHGVPRDAYWKFLAHMAHMKR